MYQGIYLALNVLHLINLYAVVSNVTLKHLSHTCFFFFITERYALQPGSHFGTKNTSSQSINRYAFQNVSLYVQ